MSKIAGRYIAARVTSRRQLLKISVGCMAGAALGSVAGCGAIRFDIGQAVPEQRVMGNVLGSLLGTFLPSPFALTVNLAQETQARGTGPAQSAGLKALSFRITNIANPPRSTDNFDFVDRIEIFIESSKSGSSLSKQKIADLLMVPRGATTLNLQCDPSVDLVPYINEGSRIASTATGRAPAQDVTFDGLITVEVRV